MPSQWFVVLLLAWYFIAAGTQYGPFKTAEGCERVRTQVPSTVKSACWEG
jgi:hypothetical protein